MKILFNPRAVLAWVLAYGLVAAVPGAMLFALPPEQLDAPLEVNGEKLLTREVLTWLPLTMGGAAAVTLATAIVLGVVHPLAAAIQGVLIRLVEKWPRAMAPAGWLASGMEWLYSNFRFVVALGGVVVVLVAVGFIWRNVAQQTLTADINYILAGVALGTGLTTGAAFYKD